MRQQILGSKERRFDAAVVAMCFVVKIVVLLIDSRVRIFMGDSATYLWSAISFHVPSDRSFSYPLFIALTAGVSGSILTLLVAQTLCGVVTAVLVARLLCDAFDMRRSIAALAALLVCVDPSQLFFERMVMTESLSTCVLVASVWTAVVYVRHGRIEWLVACVALGIVSASLRVGLVPLALSLATAAVLVRLRVAPRGEIVRHLAIAVTATCALHGAYRELYGFALHTDATYIRDGGLFRLGLVAPIVTAEDAENAGVDPAILNEVTVPLSDQRFREMQIWHSGGLIDVLKRHNGADAYRAASAMASSALHRDPFALVSFGIATTQDYFDDFMRTQRLTSDVGSGQQPDEATLRILRERFAYDARDVWRASSPVYAYYLAGWPWLVVALLALAPLSLSAFALRRTRETALLAMVSCGLVVGEILCSHIASFRYLHPFPVLTIVSAAIIADAIAVWRDRRATREEIEMRDARPA